MLTDSGLAALRMAATITHAVHGLRTRLRQGDHVRAHVGRLPLPELPGVVNLSPCAFRRAVIDASDAARSGRHLALLDLDGDPAIDIGVPSGGRTWPGGIHQVPLASRWVFAFGSPLDADRCHDLGGDLVAGATPIPGLHTLGLRADPETGVSVMYAETAAPLPSRSLDAVIDLLESLLARFATAELLADLEQATAP